jgi:hypothetical protein
VSDFKSKADNMDELIDRSVSWMHNVKHNEFNDGDAIDSCFNGVARKSNTSKLCVFTLNVSPRLRQNAAINTLSIGLCIRSRSNEMATTAVLLKLQYLMLVDEVNRSVGLLLSLREHRLNGGQLIIFNLFNRVPNNKLNSKGTSVIEQGHESIVSSSK